MFGWFGSNQPNSDKPNKRLPNPVQTCLIQVPRHLDRRLHLHVVLEEAAAERGVVVGLARLGLDGRLVPGLRHLRRHGPDAAHGGV